jgi:hypothetical protein
LPVAHKRAGRIAKFIKPLRVEPGSKANLIEDFDPRHKAAGGKDGTIRQAPKGAPADPYAAEQERK